MIQIFIIATFMGIFSFMFLLLTKALLDSPKYKVINRFFVPVGCILSLAIIIVGICGIFEFM